MMSHHTTMISESPSKRQRLEEATAKTFKLPDANSEQKLIIESIGRGNVCIDAVAGSGKTTLSLKIAEHYSSKKILLLTFNARLKTETRQRASAVGLTNIEAHSFHAFGLKYYRDPCRGDEDMLAILDQNLKPRRKTGFDIVIIDEAQDLKELFYRFVLKIFNDFADVELSHLCVLGDVFQMVYEVFGADARFLQHTSACFPLNAAQWVSRPLHTTYRLTRSMVHFINRIVLGQERLLCTKTHDEKVELYETSWSRDAEMTQDLTALWHGLIQKGYKDGEIMILAPSVKSTNAKSSINKFAHYLCNRGHKLYVDRSRDDYFASEEEVANKILFTNFVKAKGLERKLVIVLCFDASYFEYYAKDASPQTVTNAMYVALTRAKEKLVLVKDRRAEHLPFLNRAAMHSQAMRPFLVIHGTARSQASPNKDDRDTRGVGVSALCDLPNLFLYHDRLAKLVRFRVVSRNVGCREDEGSLLNTVKDGKEYNESLDITEDSSCINGLAIPIYHYLRRYPDFKARTVRHTTYAIEEMEKVLKRDEADELVTRLRTINETIIQGEPEHGTTLSPSDTLLLAALWMCNHDALYFPLVQLPRDFAWLSKTCFDAGERRLQNLLKDEEPLDLEIPFGLDCESEENRIKYRVFGVLDFQTDRSIYEFKCTKEFTFAHQLQAALYGLMVRQHSAKTPGAVDRRVRLYNINTNELWELVSEECELWQMLQLLLYAKEHPLRTISTAEFMENCRKCLLASGSIAPLDARDKPVPTRGYPVAYTRILAEPDEDDEVEFDALPDSEQANVQKWYREGSIDVMPSPYERWRALMDERETTRIQSEVEILRTRIDALGPENHATLMYDQYAFSAPLIQGFGSGLACGVCKIRLPKPECEYLSKPQRIYCAYCTQTLAEKTEIRSQPHPRDGQQPLLCVQKKREFVFIPVLLPKHQ